MDNEKEIEQIRENEISFETVSGRDDYQPNEFIEPLEEVEDTPAESNAPLTDHDGSSESNSLTSEHMQSALPSPEPLSEDDNLSGPGALEDQRDDDIENGDDTETVKAEKQKNISKLAFSIVFILAAIIVLLTYSNKWSLRLNKEVPAPAAQPEEAVPVESPIKVRQPEENDPYKGYRAVLDEVTKLRQSLLLKMQEIRELKAHYENEIVKLENDILKEILSRKIKNYQQALHNKRIELGLHTIQRRLAYIQKLDDPQHWLEQGSEELLYHKRKAVFDLQIIDIAGGIDMDMHMRHINAAIQKCRLTADNLAIDPESAKMQPLESIWQGLFDKTKDNPNLQTELDDWYIQQEVCRGDLFRIGELSNISIDTAKCVSEFNGPDLFLNNISALSPHVAKYLCQWKGKWMCLNGVQTLSPAAAQYLFQWEGEWISLNGLSQFPSELAKHLVQWKGKQLELMGLKSNKNQMDRSTLTYMAEWEKAGGKLFVPAPIRDMINQR